MNERTSFVVRRQPGRGSFADRARRLFASLSLLSTFSFAPYQCARDPKPELAREETPGDALYQLAEEFKKKNNTEAAQATLRYLVEHYPSSRHAPAARAELGLKAP